MITIDRNMVEKFKSKYVVKTLKKASSTYPDVTPEISDNKYVYKIPNITDSYIARLALYSLIKYGNKQPKITYLSNKYIVKYDKDIKNVSDIRTFVTECVFGIKPDVVNNYSHIYLYLLNLKVYGNDYKPLVMINNKEYELDFNHVNLDVYKDTFNYIVDKINIISKKIMEKR